ncbi:hypothetical protein [Stieleria mannarensis]|uniref:hypothetical protein n=1 Tax=Stieleria mannarensis TaxID=2755585 RepID=UPI001602A42B|nr:hypothetical protein [Rhodopirellula sp. JC639]
MRTLHYLFLSCFLSLPLTLGCGGNQAEPVSDTDDIEQFLADNPEMAVDMEEEAKLMAADEESEETGN